MSAEESPLVRFESGGQASVLNYNVPLPTSYGTRSIVELDFPAGYFRSEEAEAPPSTIRAELANRPFDEIVDRIRQSIDRGFQDPMLFDRIEGADEAPVQPAKPGTVEPVRPQAPGLRSGDGRAEDVAVVRGALREMAESPAALESLAEEFRSGGGARRGPPRADGGVAAAASRAAVAEDYQSVANYYKPVAALDPAAIASRIQRGEFMYLRPTLYGDLVPGFAPEPPEPQPQFAIVERFDLSNFLGNYGAGRTIKTFSLFPGEETSIRLKTFKNNTVERQEAANIFEGNSREASFEFEREVETELQTSTRQEEKSFWKAGGNAELNLGVFKIGGGGGGGGESSAVREFTAKSVSRAASKHAAKSSSRREVEVKTESSETLETGTEELIQRRIENINLSRTLNLVFRQMNQQFLTLFHLVDVRVAYSNGFPNSYREAPLYELGSLIDDVVREERQDQVEREIVEAIQNVYDYDGNRHDDVVRQVERNGATYWAVNDDKYTTYTEEATGLSKTVPGVVLSATLNTIRTDGVVVEALLGRGEALDEYSQGLQREAVRSRDLGNDLVDGELDRNRLGMEIVQSNQSDKADLYHLVFGDEAAEEEEEEEEERRPEVPPEP